MNTVPTQLRWEREGRVWPNREASRFVRAAGMHWHVQEMGEGPALLLLHGTGSSTHSWRSLMPLLAVHYRVMALDLPGHAFTQSPPRQFLSLYGMSLAIKALLQEVNFTPAFVAGHSAGAAIAVRMSLDGNIAPRRILGVNAALLPFSGMAGHLFAPLARMLVRIPVVSQMFAWRALDRKVVEKIILDSGSRLDDEGVELYATLAQSPNHVAAALGMMAEWDLPRLQRQLPKLKSPLSLLVGTKDNTIKPAEAEKIRALLPDTAVIALDGLGHLAHEESPQLVASLIAKALSDISVAETQR